MMLEATVSMKIVEFICDENVAAPGAKATPRPADRPRPTAEQLEKRAAIQSREAPAGETPVKHDAKA
jgi:hypothetical protein